MMLKISAIVIAKNEEKKIGDCLKSLSWCDEIIVVDNGSTDKTIEIAKKFDTRIFSSQARGFDEKRNLGTRAARGEWILHIDADERVTPKLQKEIRLTIKKTLFSISSYAMARKNFVFGKEMKHCGLWPDYVQHLLRRDKFIKWKGVLHETPEVKGKMGYLKNPLIHLKHDNLSEMVEKTNNWSEIEAELMFDAGHPKMNLPRFLSAMFREFWTRMIRQTAFLDGGEGVIYGLYQVWSRFLSYAKLWEMQLQSQNSKVKIQKL